MIKTTSSRLRNDAIFIDCGDWLLWSLFCHLTRYTNLSWLTRCPNHGWGGL